MLWVSCISEFIYTNDLPIGILGGDVTEKVGTNETGSTSDNNCHMIPLRIKTRTNGYSVTCLATTTRRPFVSVYSQVESVINLSPYSASTPVS